LWFVKRVADELVKKDAVGFPRKWDVKGEAYAVI
jgi:hypothetical protein